LRISRQRLTSISPVQQNFDWSAPYYEWLVDRDDNPLLSSEPIETQTVELLVDSDFREVLFRNECNAAQQANCLTACQVNLADDTSNLAACKSACLAP